MILPTTWIQAARLSEKLGVQIVLASETFQHTGSFKFRAASHLALQVSQELIITASSGNFGQALARACQLMGKRCIVVMPSTSAQVKVQAVRDYGGQVDLLDVTRKSRKTRVAELAAEHPEAYVASAYDDPHVIEGNATLGRELADSNHCFDCVVAPIGGGGLTAGLIKGLREAGSKALVLGAEPLLANDAARSLQAGHIVTDPQESPTIADGARTPSIGKLNWEILREGLSGVVEVPDPAIKAAVRALFGLSNLKVEPTGALSVAAVLTAPERFRGKSVCCVISGGNVDTKVLLAILSEEAAAP